MEKISAKSIEKSIFEISKNFDISVKVLNNLLIDGGFNRDINKYSVNKNEIEYLKNYFVNHIKNSFRLKSIQNLNKTEQSNFLELYSNLIEDEEQYEDEKNVFDSINEILSKSLDELKIEKFVEEFFIKNDSDFFAYFKKNKFLKNLKIKLKKNNKTKRNFSTVIPLNKYHIFIDEENQVREFKSSISHLFIILRDVIVYNFFNNFQYHKLKWIIKISN